MPRLIVHAPGHDRSRSLGWLGLAWMEHLVVHGPGDVQGEPVTHGDEYSAFVADCYGLDDVGRRLYDSAFLSRPKGCDKSGLGARVGLFEALGPCRFAGFAEGGEIYRDPWGLGFTYEYVKGEPMGRPVRVPYIRCMATEEQQTGNVYDSIHFNLTEGPLAEVMSRRDDAGLTRILLPGGGEITPSTASSAAKDGGKETFVDFDESHLYNTPELRRMYSTVTRNLRKRKRGAGTWFLETTTMFAPGQESIAEDTYALADRIKAGKNPRGKLLLDHRWGECDDLTDEAGLLAALEDAYGDAGEWIDLQSIVDEFHDPRAEVADSRRYFLNVQTAEADSWMAPHEWAARFDADKLLVDKDVIVLGFDGSRSRSRGVTDATALIGCRVEDGFVFELGVWEQPQGPSGEGWRVPTVEVEAAIRTAFDRYTVVGFYADPAKWESFVASWEATYGARLKVGKRGNPIEWWMTGGRSNLIVRALEQFRSAVLDGDMTHDGSSTLTRHVLNAHQKPTTSGIQIRKEHPDSPRKIDAAVAAVLAWQCRLDALSAGVGATKSRSKRLHTF